MQADLPIDSAREHEWRHTSGENKCVHESRIVTTIFDGVSSNLNFLKNIVNLAPVGRGSVKSLMFAGTYHHHRSCQGGLRGHDALNKGCCGNAVEALDRWQKAW